MKYLKGTMIAFVVGLILSSSANALSLTFSNITIPAFKGTYTSDERVKSNTTNEQTLHTINATDRISGDGRAINARVKGMLSGMSTTSWKSAPKGKVISFGSSSREIGSWKLQLQSNKNLPTKAGYWGTWDYQ